VILPFLVIFVYLVTFTNKVSFVLRLPLRFIIYDFSFNSIVNFGKIQYFVT